MNLFFSLYKISENSKEIMSITGETRAQVNKQKYCIFYDMTQKKEIFTFQKSEPVNVWLNDWNDYQNTGSC